MLEDMLFTCCMSTCLVSSRPTERPLGPILAKRFVEYCANRGNGLRVSPKIATAGSNHTGPLITCTHFVTLTMSYYDGNTNLISCMSER